MELAWSLQFDVYPRQGETAAECCEGLSREYLRWVQGMYNALGMNYVILDFDGVLHKPMPRQFVRGRGFGNAPRLFRSLTVQYPDTTNVFLSWRLKAYFVCDERRVHIRAAVYRNVEGPALRFVRTRVASSNPLAHLHPLLAYLVRDRQVRVGNELLLVQPEKLRPNLLTGFAQRTLLNPTRRLPVVVIGPEAAASMNDLDARRAQGSLFSIAKVVLLQNGSALRAFTDLVTPQWTCGEGLRLYFPGFTPKTPQVSGAYPARSRNAVPGIILRFRALLLTLTPSCHRLSPMVRAALRALRGEKPDRRSTKWRKRLHTIEEELFQAWLRAQQMTQSANQQQQKIALLENELAVARRMLTERGDTTMSQALPPPDAHAVPLQDQFLDALASEVDILRAEKQQIEAQLAERDLRLAVLEAELANSKANLATMWHAAEPFTDDTDAPAVIAPEAERTFANLADVLGAAATEFDDVLVMWQSAYESAKASPFPLLEKVFLALQSIAEVAREYFEAKRTHRKMGTLQHAFAKRVSFKFANFESATTMAQFGEQRIFHHGGERRQMQRHLTLGGGETNLCLQIYFEFDETTQRVLIGYCGKHLPFARQRT